MSDLGWHVIGGEDFLAALMRVADAEVCPYHDPLDECCADPDGWHDWRGDTCGNCEQVKTPRNPGDSASIMNEAPRA